MTDCLGHCRDRLMDMQAVDKGMEIGGLRVVLKDGGQIGGMSRMISVNDALSHSLIS